MTMAGVEIMSIETRETTRSVTVYCLVAVQAPRATPPSRPMVAPRTTRRSDTKARTAMTSLMTSPLGEYPQSQCRKTFWSQVT